MHGSELRDRWLRSELALTAGRGMAAGFVAYLVLKLVTGELEVRSWTTFLLPLVIMYMAGSRRVLAWVSRKASARFPAAGRPWMDESHLYLRWLSGRTVATLVVTLLSVMLLNDFGDTEFFAGYLLCAGIVTWFWILGCRRGRWQVTTLGVLAGCIVSAVFDIINLRYLDNSIEIVESVTEFRFDPWSAVTFKNIAPMVLKWGLFGAAGGLAIERAPATISLRLRLLAALAGTAVLVQMLPWQSGTFTLLLPALGWGIALARATTTDALLTPAHPIAVPVAASPT